MIERDDIVVAGLSHQGMVRKENQDSYGFIEPESEDILEERGRLFIVADGLGGHRGGRVASKMAVDLIGKIYFSSEKEPIYPALLHAVEIANRSIYEASNKHEELRGMATTCTALIIRDHNIFMTHVGDSRAYLVRNGAIKQVSTDHTLVEEMVHSGIINEDEAKSHPDSHILTRSLGILQAVEMDVLDPPIHFQRGDSILLCSDGLTVYVEDQEILKILNENAPDKACELLVETANERGGRDNITVEIVHYKTDAEKSRSLLEDTQPLEEKAELDGMTTVPLEEAVLQGQHQKYELGWTALFYLAYLIIMAAYFYFFFK
jgi:protein phosphatase